MGIIHTNLVRVKYPNMCVVLFSKSSSLKKHMECVHADEFHALHENLEAKPIILKCFYCNEKFSNLKQLKNHKKSQSCIQRGKVFKNKKRLPCSHVSGAYSGQIFKCFCGKQFGRRVNVKVHQEKHREKQVRTLKQLENLCERHRRRKFKKVVFRYMPRVCNKEMKATFKELVKRNPNVRQQYGRSFTDPEEFFQFAMKDEGQHSGNYKWACSICQKKFIRRSAVRNHCESIHFPSMFRYMCQVCNKEMSSKNSLESHLSRHKKVKPCYYRET